MERAQTVLNTVPSNSTKQTVPKHHCTEIQDSCLLQFVIQFTTVQWKHCPALYICCLAPSKLIWATMHQRKGLGVQFNRGIEKQHKERPAKRNCLCLVVIFLLFVICIGQTLICTLSKPGNVCWQTWPMRAQACNCWLPIGQLCHASRQTNYCVMSPPDGITLR